MYASVCVTYLPYTSFILIAQMPVGRLTLTSGAPTAVAIIHLIAQMPVGPLTLSSGAPTAVA